MWYVVGELIFIAVTGFFMWLIFGGRFGGQDEEGGQDPPGNEPSGDDDPDRPPILTEGPGGQDTLRNYVEPTEAISNEILRLEEEEDEDEPIPNPA